MSSDDPILSKMIQKLKTRAQLGAEDCAAILALPCVLRSYEPTAYIVSEGAHPKSHCSFIVSGLAFRQKLAASGSRQIVSIHMTGDFLDLPSLFLNRVDHNVQALTPVQTAEIGRKALQDLVLSRPAIAKAMWVDALVDGSIFREWVLNVGRRDARGRVAHLLCEFALKMKAAGMPENGGYELPMTQKQLGDAVGLTSVHVNRTLRSLAEEGLIERDRRHLVFKDWDGMRAVGDFSALYLHLDQVEPADA